MSWTTPEYRMGRCEAMVHVPLNKTPKHGVHHRCLMEVKVVREVSGRVARLCKSHAYAKAVNLDLIEGKASLP